MQYSSVLYGRGDSAKAKKYIDEALAQKKLPTTVQGAVYLDASRIYSRLGQFQSANKYLDQAVSIAKQTSGTHPVGVINADLGFCHLRAARTFLDQKDYHTATEMAELADKELPQKFVRRRGLIPIMYAQILLDTGDYEGALTYANDALSIAKELNEPLILAHLLYIRNRLQSVYRTRETRVFEANLAEVVGTRKIIPMAY